MIEKIYKNKYMATCDNCGTGQNCEVKGEGGNGTTIKYFRQAQDSGSGAKTYR